MIMVVKGKEMPIGYDKLSLYHNILLDLPFREGTGIVTRDVAKPHHDPVTLVGVPSWVTIVGGLGMLEFNGVTDYLECPAAATGDLDFTTDDYSIGIWTYHTNSIQSDIIIGRYAVNIDGWEFYFGDSTRQNLNMRHSHSSLGAGNLSDSCFSIGWVDNVWNFAGFARRGSSLYPQMFRNGVAVEVTYDVAGMRDPDTANRDLVIGTRFTKNLNWFHGRIWRPRVWNRSLESYEWLELFQREKYLFGV